MASKQGVRSLVIPDELWNWAKAEAKRLEISVSDLVRQALEASRQGSGVMEPSVQRPELEPTVMEPTVMEPTSDWPGDDAEPEEPAPGYGALPPGFQVSPAGAGTWFYEGWSYRFPAHKRAHWEDAIRMIREIGSPEGDPARWAAVSNEIVGWLAPRKEVDS